MIETWIQPANIKYFDVVEHFKNNEFAYWKKTNSININDVFYIYVASPYKEIKYKCKVVEDNISFNDVKKIAKYAIRDIDTERDVYIKIKLIKTYPEGKFKLEEIKKHYFGQVQVLSRADRRFKDYIREQTKGDKHE